MRGGGPLAELRRVLTGDVHVVLSKLEARLLALLRRDGLELPVMNRPAGGRRVDARWPRHALTVDDVFERGSQTIAELRRLLAAPP